MWASACSLAGHRGSCCRLRRANLCRRAHSRPKTAATRSATPDPHSENFTGPIVASIKSEGTINTESGFHFRYFFRFAAVAADLMSSRSVRTQRSGNIWTLKPDHPGHAAATQNRKNSCFRASRSSITWATRSSVNFMRNMATARNAPSKGASSFRIGKTSKSGLGWSSDERDSRTQVSPTATNSLVCSKLSCARICTRGIATSYPQCLNAIIISY